MKNFFTKISIIFGGLTIFLSASLSASAFYSDVPENHKYYNEIKSLYDLGRLPDAEFFTPDSKVTVSDFYSLLLTYTQTPITPTDLLPFTDTDPNADYAPYIKKAIELGILIPSGPNPQLEPGKLMAKFGILQSLFTNLGVGTTRFFDQDQFPFSDISSNTFAGPLAQKAYEIGILENTPEKFMMAKRITRAELASYLHKIYNYSPEAATILVEISSGGEYNYNSTQKTLVDHPSFGTLLDVWESLHDRYINSDEIDDEKLIFNAIKGLVQDVSDKYTVFQSPDETAQLVNALSSEYEGIGIVIEMIDEKIVVVAPFKNSPADTAGIEANDIITAIDGKNIDGLTVDAVSAKIKGPTGTIVKITVDRNGTVKTFDVTRKFILHQTVEGELTSNNVAYISIFSFAEDTYREFLAKATELLALKPKGFIIDLRNNPGGYMDVAVQIVGLFSKEEITSVKLEYSDGHIEDYVTDGNGLLSGQKTVILINEGSASASEILAGALQDHKLATLLGTTSFGKGSVQELRQYIDDSLFKFTISHWLTPNGKNINEIGLTPDFTVTNTGETDNQLNAALRKF